MLPCPNLFSFEQFIAILDCITRKARVAHNKLPLRSFGKLGHHPSVSNDGTHIVHEVLQQTSFALTVTTKHADLHSKNSGCEYLTCNVQREKNEKLFVEDFATK
jgi:hypothetical protein